ncbi:MAG: MqnA/MqnD/SBP family protein [Deltaproteobacteria bacterium]
MPRTLRLAFSPDADDAFMFHALLAGHVAHPDFRFVARRADTEALNESATGADPDEVIAISIAHYASIASRYLLLPHGGSVGEAYGPVVVAPGPPAGAGVHALAGRRVAVPGLRTTAYVTLSLLCREAGVAFEPMVVPITPHAAVFEVVARGEADAALLIHEGRLTYARRGLHRWLDLGEAWHAATALPLPLGGNAIRRDLGAETIAAVSALLRESIVWALEHRDRVIDALASDAPHLSRAELDHYLTLYANHETLGYSAESRRGVEVLLGRAADAGLLPRVAVEFAP